jgi:C4-dicarboxylate-specific signal transduction histidine kinase
MTVLAQFLAHRLVATSDQLAYVGAFNTAVSVMAIALSAYLVLRGQSAESALRRAQSDLAHVTRITTMGELTASIAHEVNQPIAGVVANASACLRWLDAGAPNLEEARAATARIVRDGTRASEIISRIRLIVSRGSPQRTVFNINPLVRETAELLGSEAARYATSIRLDLAADSPPILADRVQVQQVLVNLVVNGIDAMKGIEGPRELTIRSRRSDTGHLAVAVSDNGVGLPSDAAEKLFDAFVTTKPDGTGIGLSISRSIIEAHGGQLSASPNAARGATFHFTLPASDAMEVAEASIVA